MLTLVKLSQNVDINAANMTYINLYEYLIFTFVDW